MEKKLFVTICLLIAAFGLKAQADIVVKRNIIARLYKGYHVNDCEFIYNYFDETNNNLAKKDFVAVLRNDSNEIIGFLHNEGLVKLVTKNDVRKIKIGYDNDYVVVNKIQNVTEIITNNTVKRHDTIVELFENGYVFGSSGFFYYRDYHADTSNDGMLTYCMPKKSVLDDDKEFQVKFSDRPFNIHLDNGHEIFTTSEEHYYFVYKTSLMEQAVIVVDGKGYVLDGKSNNVRFKYSANCNNWIACCDDYLLVNGAKFLIKDKSIRDFFINDEGDFACILDYKSDENNTSDLCINGQIHLRNVEIFSLQLKNSTEWIYRYKKGNMFYEGNGYIYTIYTNRSFYFDYNNALEYGKDVSLKSDDGKHAFTYKTKDEGTVEIDGKKIKTNRPHSVFWNNNKKAFVWTNYENNVLYLNTYKVIK